MNNAEKFQEVFGYYATEMWAKPESEFLEWINSNYTPTIDIVRCGECKKQPICCRGKIPLNDNGYCSEGERIEK